MNVLMFILPSVLILLTVVAAAAPWGAPSGSSFVLQVMPYMMAHLFLARGRGFVPSPVIFIAGLALDVASDGPLGFWAFIYLFGVLIARQLPEGLMHTQLGRLSGLLLLIFALSAAQVGLASLYQLQWVDWHAVLAGTLVAGFITALLDFGWQMLGPGRAINVTARGAAGKGGHV